MFDVLPNNFRCADSCILCPLDIQENNLAEFFYNAKTSWEFVYHQAQDKSEGVFRHKGWMKCAYLPLLAWPLISHVTVGVGRPCAEQSKRAESSSDTTRLVGRRFQYGAATPQTTAHVRRHERMMIISLQRWLIQLTIHSIVIVIVNNAATTCRVGIF